MIKQTSRLDEYLLKQSATACLSEHTISCIFRAMVEPILEMSNDSIKSDVVFKVTNRDLFTGLLTRIEFSGIQYVDFGDDVKGKEILEETDFLLVATSDFISFLSWKQTDYGLKYWSYTNSSEIDEIVKILNSSSDIDLSFIQSKYNTEELSSTLTNVFITKLANMVDGSKETNTDVVDNDDLADRISVLTKKSRYISHEIKNQLSICDLYSGIIKRYCENNEINDKTITKSVTCIDNSLKVASSTLSQLQTINSKELKLYKTNILVETASELSEVYAKSRNIKLIIDNKIDEEIFVDKTMFISTIVNLVKNATEAFEDFSSKDNWIKISTKTENDNVLIQVENNAKEIENPEMIFEEGMTTKSTGNGLGLFICKQNVEEQCGQIELTKTDKESTVFEIKFSL